MPTSDGAPFMVMATLVVSFLTGFMLWFRSHLVAPPERGVYRVGSALIGLASLGFLTLAMGEGWFDP